MTSYQSSSTHIWLLAGVNIGPWLCCCNPQFSLMWSVFPQFIVFIIHEWHNLFDVLSGLYFPCELLTWESSRSIQAVELRERGSDAVRCSLFSSDDWVCGKARLRVDSSRPAVDKPQFALAGRAHSCSRVMEKEGGLALTRTGWRSLSLSGQAESVFTRLT